MNRNTHLKNVIANYREIWKFVQEEVGLRIMPFGGKVPENVPDPSLPSGWDVETGTIIHVHRNVAQECYNSLICFPKRIVVPAYQLYDSFSKVCSDKEILSEIPRGSESIESFRFVSDTCGLVDKKFPDYRAGAELKAHLETILKLVREK